MSILATATKDLTNIVLYHQLITPGSPNSHYLDNETDEAPVYAGGEHDGYEKEFKPAKTGGTVIVGLAIKSSGSSVSNLLLQLAELQSA